MPANRTYVLGLTGATGCGKSEAAQFLRSLGARVADAAAALLKECMEGVMQLEVPLQTDITTGGDWRACK